MTDKEIKCENTAETVRDLMQNLLGTEHIVPPSGMDLSSAHIVGVASARQIQDITRMHRDASEHLKPSRRKGTAHMEDLESLVSWANRFKGETSVLYAKPDMAAPRITCIADYHAAGAIDPTNLTGDPSARHCHHRAVYTFPMSDEWKAWTAVSGKPLEKDELGEFIEEQAKDIMDPSPAIISMKEGTKNEPWENRLIQTAAQIEGRYGQLTQLLAMSKQFQVFESSDLEVKTNRDTGEATVHFMNEHKDAAGKPINIPNLLIIAIPVFKGGALYRMPVRFRYRKSGPKISFILKIYNPEKAMQAAFDEAVATATVGTELPIFKGSPES